MEALLHGPAWVRYSARIELLGEDPGSATALRDYREMAEDSGIRILLAELAGWPGGALKRHNDAGHLLHKLCFLVDIGLKADVPEIRGVLGRIAERRSAEGPFQIILNISEHYGGTGQDTWVWMLCDAPLLLYALHEFGYNNILAARRGVEALVALNSGAGWPCASCPEMGKFRGPGRKDDPCPQATLLMLKLLARFDEYRDSPQARNGAEALLSLWERRREKRPYLFGMGTDFCKLKAPLIWYDILHVMDVLSQFHWLLGDDRLLEMAGILSGKPAPESFFTPESVYKAWSGWEFGQKKAPSLWVTFLVERILKRLPGINNESIIESNQG